MRLKTPDTVKNHTFNVDFSLLQINRLIKSTGITVSEQAFTNKKPRKSRPTHRNVEPPKYNISICTAKIMHMIKTNCLFFESPASKFVRSLLVVMHIASPVKINKAKKAVNSLFGSLE